MSRIHFLTICLYFRKCPICFCRDVLSMPCWISDVVALLAQSFNCSHKLTALDHDGHGGLLDNGAYFGEGDKATVIPTTVLLQGIREVQVAIEVHGNPVILINVLETWKKNRFGSRILQQCQQRLRLMSTHVINANWTLGCTCISHTYVHWVHQRLNSLQQPPR